MVTRTTGGDERNVLIGVWSAILLVFASLYGESKASAAVARSVRAIQDSGDGKSVSSSSRRQCNSVSQHQEFRIAKVSVTASVLVNSSTVIDTHRTCLRVQEAATNTIKKWEEKTGKGQRRQEKVRQSTASK